MASGTTAVWQRPYPVAGDTPSVHTDIQGLANALDAFPPFPATMVTSATAVAGQSYVVSASQTLTLPAAPVKGDTIRASAASTVTGATSVSVTASGGKGINGVGLSAASTFKLGTPFAHATLQYDGTNWQIIDGQQDTGWVALTLSGGWTTYNPGPSFYTPAARIIGNVVNLRGAATSAGGTGPASLPSATYAPASSVRVSMAGGFFFTIIAAGTAITASASITIAYFDGVVYSLA